MEPEQIRVLLYWAGVAVFLLLELRLSYRRPTISKFRRWFTNLPLSVLNGAVYYLVYTGFITSLLLRTEAESLGLLNAFVLPTWLKIVLGVLVLDFAIYLWHLLAHRVPFVWRFHRVHHSDMNMDVSTANRFHLGEFLLSGLVRIMVISALGVPFMAYFLFEVLVNLSVQFHHSSITVNPAFEKIWVLLFVPPFLHRIHHSVKIRERDSNYGVLFSIWDRMLGTLVTAVDQQGIVIGIGSHRAFEKLGFWHLLRMPLAKRSL